MQNMTVQDLKTLINQEASQGKTHLIDVREAHEREAFNIGGEHLPIGDLPAKVGDLSYEKDARIVVYCRSGQRSKMGQHLLNQAGFSDVWNLEGGMLAWQEMESSSK